MRPDFCGRFFAASLGSGLVLFRPAWTAGPRAFKMCCGAEGYIFLGLLTIKFRTCLEYCSSKEYYSESFFFRFLFSVIYYLGYLATQAFIRLILHKDTTKPNCQSHFEYKRHLITSKYLICNCGHG